MSETKEQVRTKRIRHTPLLSLDECVDNAMDEWAAIQCEERDKRIKKLEDFVADVARGQHGELKAGFIHRIMGQAKQLLTDK